MFVEDPGMPEPAATLFREEEVSNPLGRLMGRGKPLSADFCCEWLFGPKDEGDVIVLGEEEEDTYEVLAEVGIGGGTCRSAIALTLFSLFFKAAKADD